MIGLLLLFACHVFETATVECVKGEACVGPGEPPSMPTVSISPARPKDADDLTVSVVEPSVDPEGKEVSYRYVWFRNDSELTNFNEDTVPQKRTVDGDVWRVQVYPSDGTLEGDPGEAQVAVGTNQEPILSSVTISPSNPTGDDTLSAQVIATDADNDPLVMHYRWFMNGEEQVALGDRDSVPASQHVPGQSWTFTVTVDDGFGSVEATSPPVEIDGPSIVKLRSTFSGSYDLSSAKVTGHYRFNFYSEGPYLGFLDCRAAYDVASTQSTSCSSCVFSYSVRLTHNEGESSLSPGCESLAVDTRGTLKGQSYSYYYYVSLNSPQLSLPLYFTEPPNYYDYPNEYNPILYADNAYDNYGYDSLTWSHTGSTIDLYAVSYYYLSR
jgi:hypothetical protein